mmetsp:Transcript_31480/g.92318  ORF Transcript_31480/g.92318 Transcript_31480/m.92318 type:complete len:90 (-) Transcript_31480:269-538(-)
MVSHARHRVSFCARFIKSISSSKNPSTTFTLNCSRNPQQRLVYRMLVCLHRFDEKRRGRDGHRNDHRRRLGRQVDAAARCTIIFTATAG